MFPCLLGETNHGDIMSPFLIFLLCLLSVIALEHDSELITILQIMIKTQQLKIIKLTPYI